MSKSFKWRCKPVWHRMLYSCTNTATVGVKGLNYQDWMSKQMIPWLMLELQNWTWKYQTNINVITQNLWYYISKQILIIITLCEKRVTKLTNTAAGMQRQEMLNNDKSEFGKLMSIHRNDEDWHDTIRCRVQSGLKSWWCDQLSLRQPLVTRNKKK